MDPVTLATGITGFLAIALDVGKILSEYISQYTSAPTDAQNLLEEITALSDVLKQLVKFLEEEDVKQDFHQTSVLCRVIDLCKGEITSLRSSLVKLKKSGGFKDRLRWPFRKQECMNVASTLHHYAQTLQFSLTIANCELLSKTSREVFAKLSNQRKRMANISLILSDMPAYMVETRETLDALLSLLLKIDNLAINVQEIKDGVQSLQQNMDAENMEKLLTWLSPLEPHKRHQAIQASRVKHTGTWLLQSEQFRLWIEGKTNQHRSGQILGCSGEPGAGKTVIALKTALPSSLVIDYISTTFSERLPLIGITFLYCDYRDKKEQTLLHILGSLVKQLASQCIYTGIRLPEHVQSTYKTAQESRKTLDLGTGTNLLKSFIQELGSTFILIDALDELQDRTRTDFLQVIDDIMHLKTNLRIFFTARPHVQEEVNRHLAHEEDIRTYLKHKIHSDHKDAMNEQLSREILEIIPKKAAGMFLLAALHIDMILDELTTTKRRSALYNLPPGLHAAYDGTIDRMRESPRRFELGMKVLMWIYLAEQVLKVVELQHALSVEDGAETLDPDNFPSKSTLLHCCCGLVTVDNETSTVRLVHYTLQEYFDSYGEKYFPFGHNLIARTCLTYLSFPGLAADANEDIKNSRMPEYDYGIWEVVDEPFNGATTQEGNVITPLVNLQSPCFSERNLLWGF
ncbi:hypothetical protein BDZ91DRAFT_821773 [Kalaharituber pfeilii]|nr:hypothetical protein BDZ91DRAFT_821773 [Kalaharituber pfeilii]